MRLRITLLGVDEVRELGGIPDEEDRGVIANQIPVTLFSPQLDSETTRVTSSVSRATFASDCAESNRRTGPVSYLAEKIRTDEVSYIVRNLEITVGTGTLGMDDTLRNTLAIKVGQKVDKMEIYIVKFA